MDGKVRYASDDSCLAKSPPWGMSQGKVRYASDDSCLAKSPPWGMSHCPMGTVPLLDRVTQAVSRLAKAPKTQWLVR
jgi:hypothetical protein